MNEGPGKRLDLPPRPARLRDGRCVLLRHGAPGDEAGIAHVVVAAFPVYARAARGDSLRAARAYARELRPEPFVVAVLAPAERVIGVSCLSGRGSASGGRLVRLRAKLENWGLYGLLCFGLDKLRARLFESVYRVRPGELYRYLDAVDPGFRSLGVGRHIADFVDDYGRAAGHHTVSAKHRADNHPVLSLHRGRGCVLLERPPTRLARLFGQPPTVISTRRLGCA
jgi:GNAT superfamily N-acetyltransferase